MRPLINQSPYRISIPGGPIVERGARFKVESEPLSAWLEGPIGRAAIAKGWIVGADGATLEDAEAVKSHASGSPEKKPGGSSMTAKTADSSGPVVRASYAEIEAETDPDVLAKWLTAANLSDKKKKAIEARLSAVVEGEG